MNETEQDIDPEARVDNAEYDLATAKRAWCGTPVWRLEVLLKLARDEERGAIVARSNNVADLQLARFAIQKRLTKALYVKAAEDELRAAQDAAGVERDPL